MAHSSGRMTTTYGPSCRTASGGTRHGRAYQQAGLAAWQTRPLGDLEVVYAYLDALALRVRSRGKVVRVPVSAVVGVLADGQKGLVELDLCGGESYEAWKGCLDGLVGRGLKAPLLCILDGHAGLRRAVGGVWGGGGGQRCGVHKLRNLEHKAPKHVRDELRADFHGGAPRI